MKNKLNTIEEALKAIRNGEIIIVVDDESRENSPLIKAKDAIIIDNSNQTPDQVFDFVSKLVNKRLNI